MQSYPIKFDHVVVAKEKSKYLSSLRVQEVMDSLQVHEEMVYRFDQCLEWSFQSNVNLERVRDEESQLNQSYKFNKKRVAHLL